MRRNWPRLLRSEGSGQDNSLHQRIPGCGDALRAGDGSAAAVPTGTWSRPAWNTLNAGTLTEMPGPYCQGNWEVMEMTRQELKSLEEEGCRQFRQEGAIWETQGVLGEIVAKVDEALQESDAGGLKSRPMKGIGCRRPSSPFREEARHVR